MTQPTEQTMWRYDGIHETRRTWHTACQQRSVEGSEKINFTQVTRLQLVRRLARLELTVWVGVKSKNCVGLGHQVTNFQKVMTNRSRQCKTNLYRQRRQKWCRHIQWWAWIMAVAASTQLSMFRPSSGLKNSRCIRNWQRAKAHITCCSASGCPDIPRHRFPDYSFSVMV